MTSVVLPAMSARTASVTCNRPASIRSRWWPGASSSTALPATCAGASANWPIQLPSSRRSRTSSASWRSLAMAMKRAWSALSTCTKSLPATSTPAGWWTWGRAICTRSTLSRVKRARPMAWGYAFSSRARCCASSMAPRSPCTPLGARSGHTAWCSVATPTSTNWSHALAVKCCLPAATWWPPSHCPRLWPRRLSRRTWRCATRRSAWITTASPQIVGCCSAGPAIIQGATRRTSPPTCGPKCSRCSRNWPTCASTTNGAA
ncbi:hypothetical protein D3C81_1363260 [compost metagenome]